MIIREWKIADNEVIEGLLSKFDDYLKLKRGTNNVYIETKKQS